jgi:hypothetical protein
MTTTGLIFLAALAVGNPLLKYQYAQDEEKYMEEQRQEQLEYEKQRQENYYEVQLNYQREQKAIDKGYDSYEDYASEKAFEKNAADIGIEYYENNSTPAISDTIDYTASWGQE